MAETNGIGNTKISLNTEPLSRRIQRRSPEFSERVKAAVLDVNSKQNIGDESIEAVIQEKMGIHEGMMALGSANTSLKLLAQVRNKVMAAYNEVMRMQV
ncbi:MAG: flagellar hook-basal body complex protein FliE [Proteobacteria bacterium]|nr:flagellar hook-basal body complex protein FliE [Desulfobacula sp.]MBU3953823.1 flagellar hook-basal body complex protein FliE [Pseudomonadota bacterium]MBU4130866.1 flagellar hook-basal body complex protein FliE [Pseudomonadota bacterium]